MDGLDGWNDSLLCFFVCLFVLCHSTGCYFSTPLPMNTTTTGVGTCGAFTSSSSAMALSSTCSVACDLGYVSTVSTWMCVSPSEMKNATWACFAGCDDDDDDDDG